MTTLAERLKVHERALKQLGDPLYQDSTSPEVRSILIATCKEAIDQLRRDIAEEDAEEVSGNQ